MIFLVKLRLRAELLVRIIKQSSVPVPPSYYRRIFKPRVREISNILLDQALIVKVYA